ncbi:uncharacterized protein M421DRAFT_420004 [Didymella exigua CBS 183.55]|uniref:Wax synthase domain-containing protein n=1 Tax=Didymella exigua CBS 183.55 TaxID=1150837 RepID=A0A6A5RW33_9PLEO|nr:uncharacterized protein M421DRAFT_420004 [Didymella exigua CBS 183.55]KAF1929477.1 hypothetical protein M421DRAFT_420004 [Didymella exigua CBS 183.55]
MALHLPPLFTTLQAPLIILTNILTLAIGPRNRLLQFAFSVPVLFLLAAQSLYRDWDRGWGLHYGLSCFVVTNLAVWADWALLASPDREGWAKLEQRSGAAQKEKEKESRGEGEGAFPKDDGGVVESKRGVQGGGVPTSFCARLWWAIRLSATTRYIGWSCEVKNVPPSVPVGYPRSKFLFRKTARFALFYLLKDAVYAHTASSPHGTWLDLHRQTPAGAVIGFEASPYLHRLYWTWIYIALTYISLELLSTTSSLLLVSTSLAHPWECPRMFADLRGAHTVRAAWSVVWHQQMRRLCSAPGIFLARDVLRLNKGGFASKYTQLLVGFGVSGCIHAAAAMLCHKHLDDDGAMRVFVSQALLIFVEDHVIALAKRCGCRNRWTWRLVGAVWTVGAIGTSLMGWTGRGLGHGLWVHDRERDFFGLGPR